MNEARKMRLDKIVAGCGICGSPMVSIRPRVPEGYRRVVCPTCLADRMYLIREYTNPDYGQACEKDTS